MPTLETERLILRDFVLTDWDALNALLSDPSVTRFMPFASWDEGKRREWLAWLVQDASNSHRDAYNWAMTLRSNGLLIGWLIIGRSRHASEAGTRECGYALNQRFWGQGYMPEAVQGVFTYEFTVLGTHRIIAECETQNIASARVMQKSGMEYEGMFYDADFEGNWANRYRYRITSQLVKTLWSFQASLSTSPRPADVFHRPAFLLLFISLRNPWASSLQRGSPHHRKCGEHGSHRALCSVVYLTDRHTTAKLDRPPCVADRPILQRSDRSTCH